MRNFIIMGPPGSGKDTQIEALLESHNLTMISSGDIARKLASENNLYKEIIAKGELLDDKVIIKEVEKEISQIEPALGIIFDGFPRTVIQAEKLNEILVNNGRTLDAAVYIHVEEEEIVKRLSSRLVCPICKRNLDPHNNICPECNVEGIRRSDDEPVTVINRIQTFLDKTMPLVSYYKDRGILYEINGEQSVENVTKDILERLDFESKV